jgi:hypothetical protein
MNAEPIIGPGIETGDAIAIIDAVRAKTDEVIAEVQLGEYGPEVKTGRLYGHIWQVRKAKAGWKVLYGHQWCT